jgi:putative nucleotidyltransferase-like protein
VSEPRPLTAAERAWLIGGLRALGARRPAPLAPADLDWPAVLDVADAEDLLPAVAHALAASGWTGVTAGARRRLTDALTAGRGRHLLMTRALGRILKQCAAEGLAVIVLKGPVLADSVYPLPALRPCGDLDLLVRPADRLRMDGVLRELGLRRVADEHSWDFDIAYDGATVYETADGVRIDLHWSLLTEPRFVWNAAEAEIWERSVPITVAGEAARGLGCEDLVLYLAAHLAVHHTLAGLRRYWDVALLLERRGGEVDWPALRARAARWGVGRALFFVLRGARALFGAPVPPAVLAALRPRGPRAWLLAALVRRSDDGRLLRLEHLVTLLLVDRGRDLAGALRHALWPSAGWMRARYGIDAASRPALYRAHGRRLGGVVGGAAAALVRRGAHQLR